MIKLKYYLVFFSCLYILFPAAGNAAYPFCILRNNTYFECIYDHTQGCRKDADFRNNTYCVLSPDVEPRYIGAEKYCIIDSTLLALCSYTDRTQCNEDAAARQSICIDRKVDEEDKNPYQYDERIQR